MWPAAGLPRPLHTFPSTRWCGPPPPRHFAIQRSPDLRSRRKTWPLTEGGLSTGIVFTHQSLVASTTECVPNVSRDLQNYSNDIATNPINKGLSDLSCPHKAGI